MKKRGSGSDLRGTSAQVFSRLYRERPGLEGFELLDRQGGVYIPTVIQRFGSGVRCVVQSVAEPGIHSEVNIFVNHGTVVAYPLKKGQAFISRFRVGQVTRSFCSRVA